MAGRNSFVIARGLSVLAVELHWTRVDAGECRHDLGRRNGNIVRVQVDRRSGGIDGFRWRKLCPKPPATVNPGSLSFTPDGARDAVAKSWLEGHHNGRPRPNPPCWSAPPRIALLRTN